LSYAHDRVQGRVIDKSGTQPIVGHPDVRRMLIDMKAQLMGARAICMATAFASDLAAVSGDDEMRKAAHDREALLTPIAKSYGSEGTNGIQAMDLVGRKLRRDGGNAMQALIADLTEVHTMAADMAGYDIQAQALSEGLNLWGCYWRGFIDKGGMSRRNGR